MKSDNKSYLVALIILAIILVGFNIAVLATQNKTEVINNNIVYNITNVTYENPDYILSQSEFEDQAIEDKALELAMESYKSIDFKKAAFDALKSYGESIESYKDITSFVLVDVDVQGNEVEFDVKVYYFIDGDEEEAYKARFDKFTIEVDDLEFDDNFEDAEVNEEFMDNLSVKKVYSM